MERIVYGWQTAGVCDRLTAMLLIHCVAQKTGRKPLWHWVTNRNCNCPFHNLFETDFIEVSESMFGLNGVVRGNSFFQVSVLDVAGRGHCSKGRYQ
jgi:hypothetical protein